MKIILIRRKFLILFCCILLAGWILFSYSDILENKIVAVMSKNKVLPIYCVDRDDQKISISFDAAWGDQYSEEILDILDRYQVKTTFFLVGFWVDKYPDMVKKIHERGHEIGNHSTTHPHMTQLSDAQIAEELNQTGEKIEKLIGKKPNLFRPPFGDYNDGVIEVAKANGYYSIQWDVDSLDWKELGVQPVVDRVLRNVKKGSIVLFHNNAKYVTEYLPLVIERLQKEGYEIVPISELIMKDNFYVDHTGMQRRLKDN